MHTFRLAARMYAGYKLKALGGRFGLHHAAYFFAMFQNRRYEGKRFYALYRDSIFAKAELGEIANAHVSPGCASIANLDDGSLGLSRSF